MNRSFTPIKAIMQIDGSHDQMRLILDRSRPFYVSGTKVEVFVLFSEEAEAFKIRPTTFTFNPPRAVARSGELVLRDRLRMLLAG